VFGRTQLKYTLLSQKYVDFKLFTEIIKLMDDKAHLRMEGLHKIIRIKSTLNLGLSEKLKTSFSDIKPIERSIFIPTTILDFY